MGKGLNAKQTLFAQEYLIDRNGTQAAIRAGYSAKTAGSKAVTMLQISAIKALVDKGNRSAAEQLGITHLTVLGALRDIAFGDVRELFGENGELVKPHDLSDKAAALIGSIEVVTTSKGEGAVEHVARLKPLDRLKAMDMLGKHLRLFNEKEQLDVNVNFNINTGVPERSAYSPTEDREDEDE